MACVAARILFVSPTIHNMRSATATTALLALTPDMLTDYSVQSMNAEQREDAVTREILEAIDAKSDITQRYLAGHMGVALGLANSYLKRCVNKGLVKIKQAPANRYLYYLTPKGFAEKGRLTASYLSYSFSFYRSASESCAELLSLSVERGYTRLGLYGHSDLAEIAAFRAIEFGIEIPCLVHTGAGSVKLLDIPVVRTLSAAPEVDAWLFTELRDPAPQLKDLSAKAGRDKVLVPSILGLQPGTAQ